jgi:hypothetical protein
MDMRDYFAAKAIQGIFANSRFVKATKHQEVAEWAYEVADAMMKAREE